MEKLIQKVRSLTLTLLILAIISLTWLVVDYFTLKSIFVENNFKLDVNWILIIISAVPVALMIIIIFFLSLFVWRLRSKYRSTLKKMEKEKQKEIETEKIKAIEESSSKVTESNDD